MSNTSFNSTNILSLKKKIFNRLLLIIPLFGVVFFLPAGTIFYWHAWVYLSIVLIPMFFVLAYLLKHNPALLDRRLRLKEKQTEQKKIIHVSWFFSLFAFLLPGFDYRFGWSSVPVWGVVVADIIVFLGYLFFFRVLQENSFASRVIEIEPEQKVISTGPYALVRHPMYLAVLIMYLFSPIALGSWWALIPALATPIILVARIIHEEKILNQELAGYHEYTQKTLYRLIPGIW